MAAVADRRSTRTGRPGPRGEAARSRTRTTAGSGTRPTPERRSFRFLGIDARHCDAEPHKRPRDPREAGPATGNRYAVAERHVGPIQRRTAAAGSVIGSAFATT